jgi:site-specific recombinase XerD
MSNPRAVRISGPLSGYVDDFCDELAGQGFTPDTASLHLRLMADLSGWLAAEGLEGSDLTEARVDEFFQARRARGCRVLVSRRSLVPLMVYLSGLGVAPPLASVATSDEVLVVAYRRHLVVERGLAPCTVDRYLDVARWTSARWEAPGRKLDAVSAGEVSALVLDECRQRNAGSVKALVTGLRSWLRFLAGEGVTSHDLAGAVPAVASWRGGWVPRGLSESEVAAVLAAVDTTSRAGLRDRAVLVMLARLGLRCAEVAALALDDVDWRQGEIVVRGKGGRSDRLPLVVDVGEALAAYLRDGRPKVASRAVFVKAQAPLVALTADGVGGIVACAGRRAGVRASAHRLRHSAATAMLRGGASLGEIGQILRHADAATTAIYAKVDYQALRALAPRWPGRAA